MKMLTYSDKIIKVGERKKHSKTAQETKQTKEFPKHLKFDDITKREIGSAIMITFTGGEFYIHGKNVGAPIRTKKSDGVFFYMCNSEKVSYIISNDGRYSLVEQGSPHMVNCIWDKPFDTTVTFLNGVFNIKHNGVLKEPELVHFENDRMKTLYFAKSENEAFVISMINGEYMLEDVGSLVCMVEKYGTSIFRK